MVNRNRLFLPCGLVRLGVTLTHKAKGATRQGCMTKDNPKILHLKKSFGDDQCLQCKADLSNEGNYTFSIDTYKNPPLGYVKCRAIWVE
jgi:hypothetical protein